jgi:hypothetical protein
VNARAGQINAMGLLDEILHHVMALFKEQKNPQLMEDAMNLLKEKLGIETVDETLRLFAEEFPPSSVYAATAGWIKTSTPFMVKGNNRESVCQKCLGEGLGLSPKENMYTIFRDHATGLEYIRNCKELFEKGLYIELEAYKKNILLDSREVEDEEEGIYSQLAEMLQGKGVPPIDETLRQHFWEKTKKLR